MSGLCVRVHFYIRNDRYFLLPVISPKSDSRIVRASWRSYAYCANHLASFHFAKSKVDGQCCSCLLREIPYIHFSCFMCWEGNYNLQIQFGLSALVRDTYALFRGCKYTIFAGPDSRIRFLRISCIDSDACRDLLAQM